MKKIKDLEQYRTNVSAEYSPAWTFCPNCYHHFEDNKIELYPTVFEYFHGIQEDNKGLRGIFECPKCFSKFWFHIDKNYHDLEKREYPDKNATCETIIDIINDGRNKTII